MKTENTTIPRFLHITFISFLAIVLYYNALPNGFSVDDFQFVVNNPAVHGLTWRNLQALFTSVPNKMEYLPVKDLTYILDVTLFGISPFALHVSNVVWYILACISFYFFMTYLVQWFNVDFPQVPLIATVIFVAHPMHVASVASICQRKDLVSGVLIFLAMRSFLLFRMNGGNYHYAAAFGLFVLALLSKATVMSVPLFLLANEYLAPKERRVSLYNACLFVAPFIFAVAVFIQVESYFLHQTGVLSNLYSSTVSYGIRGATAVQAFFYYIKMMLWPYPMLMIYDFGFVKSVVTAASIISGIGFILCIASIRLFRNSSPLVACGILWLIVTLLPVVGLIPSNTLIAERYLFLPLAGFAIFFSVLLQIFSDRSSVTRLIGTICLIAGLAVFSLLTVQRNPEWRDNLTLLLANARDVPGKAGIYYQIGNEYFAMGEFGNALDYLGRAKNMNPLYRVHYAVHTAVLAYQSGNLRQAKADLDSIDHPFKMQFVEVNYLYGKLSQSEGDFEKASRYYSHALKSTIPVGLVKPPDITDAIRSLNSSGIK